MSHPLTATTLGYPRIGGRRELKHAVEAYWAGELDADGLQRTTNDIRAEQLRHLGEAGLTSVPSNIFSLYDHVLDAAVTVDAIPPRYREPELSDLDIYFAMARGTTQLAPLELTKWFDTNYHYLVPEVGPATDFRARADKPVAEYRQSRAAGLDPRPVLLGPVSFLLLAKAAAGSPHGFRPLDRLDDLVGCYLELIEALAVEGAQWIQLDEPAFNLDSDDAELAALSSAYHRLVAEAAPKLLVAGGYGSFGKALPVLLDTEVAGLALDLVSDASDLDQLARLGPVRDTVIVAGLVDGRNVWRTDVATAAGTLGTLLGLADHIGVSTSCSLLHVPIDLAAETKLDPALRARLAFARQKLTEVVDLAGLIGDAGPVSPRVSAPAPDSWRNDTVRTRLQALSADATRRHDFTLRAAAQRDRLALPPLPCTTIGSFPQTGEVRAARGAYRAGRLAEADYLARMRGEIERVVELQEKLGLDVLVHGEPERNDMVQYFAEALGGFAGTTAGWVQSYGSRCVRPPILYADVTRPSPITVEWSTYAQSLTAKPVKGMLTGPVTILAWSFVRNDQPAAETARQVALALRDEVHDLEAAGIRVIQVDEPALRELLPPRQTDRAEYLAWATEAFRLATSGVADSTQIHTHLCYSEFGEVIDGIAALDADVTSIEASRSKMEVLDDLKRAGYRQEVGPGVYDIHSPRVPEESEIADSLRAALRAVPAERLWVNPDCGLKTRGYAEVTSSLTAMVSAARQLRSDLD